MKWQSRALTHDEEIISIKQRWAPKIAEWTTASSQRHWCHGPKTNSTTQSRWPQNYWRTQPPRTAYSRKNLSYQWAPLSSSQQHCAEYSGTEEHQRASSKVEKTLWNDDMLCSSPRCAKHRVTAPQEHQNGHWTTQFVASKHHCPAVNNEDQSRTLLNNVWNYWLSRKRLWQS